MPADAGRLSNLKTFLLSRLRGEAALATVFWRDMMLVGTMINAAATLAAMALLASEIPIIAALLMFLAPLPWNLFLFFSVWRSAERAEATAALAAKAGATIWLGAAILL
ncbi:hypothetical protein [Chelativorans sp. AA-79]|uniref:hypothetical protein n=1 Tax=Chelativorans sp. AA-79 TaxID=3028735 RepID=UPI0023FA0C5B|nr:hypothetical protein [Chelativorans sp. AA-79]WEX08551.1 hypothetical protein PVE73_21160 [Chelativorans sp. AA-79]